MYTLSFLFTLHIALSAYINSTFLTQIISEKYVGLLYTAASVLTLILLTKSANLLGTFGNKKFVLYLLLVNMLGLLGLILSSDPYVIGLSFIALLSTNTLVLLCLDIFIEHFGSIESIGKTRGLYLTITNLAWMLSPLITAMLIAREGGYKAIYVVAFFTTLVTAIGLLMSVKKFKDKVYQKTPFLETYTFLKKNPHMLAITIINFILQFFFVWMVIYTPIYLIGHIGFVWDQIGVIFTIMLAPFVIFGLPIGILIDRYHVKKRALIYIGFIITIVSTALIAFLTTHSIAIWALVLFLTRMGAAIIETTSEIYFFTHVTEEETYLLGIFRDMVPISYIVAPLLATMVFAYLPFKYLYIVLSIILLSGFYYINHLKHTHGPEQKNLS
jgi:MFS family permease